MDTSIAIASSKREYAYCVGLRALVFVHEQGCDLGAEFDEYEENSTHYLMRVDKNPVATARYRIIDADTAQIERIVVLKGFRGKGHGKNLVSYLTNELRLKPEIKKIVMSAQDHALPFYEGLGYSSVGEGYLDPDSIPHHKIEMFL